MPSPPTTPNVPDWFPKAGLVVAVLTLAFFMTLVLLSVFGKLPPPGARFLVVMTLSLAAAFSFTFLGANAFAKGHLPLPFATEHPIRFGAAGGVAVFVIVFLLGSWVYPEAYLKPEPRLLSVGGHVALNSGPLPKGTSATITVIGLRDQWQTDANGSFEFRIPDTFESDSLSLIVAYGAPFVECSGPGFLDKLVA